MDRIPCLALLGLVLLLVPACTAPAPDLVSPGLMTRQMVAERASVVLVTARNDVSRWQGKKFTRSSAPDDADGGSAAPITEDGYFLTADHVLARVKGKNVFVFYGRSGTVEVKKARVVWRSRSADLALLHVPGKTPYYYEWTPRDKWLPAGTEVIHGGIVTGFHSQTGRMSTSLSPEGPLTRARRFKIDIPLLPGDSGGPVVDAVGALVGINSAVEFLVPMETAFFVDSECTRPNTRAIAQIIRSDRARYGRAD